MMGPAYAWYKWLTRNNYTQDWVVFAAAIRKCFVTNLYDNPQEALKELKQTGSIADTSSSFYPTKLLGYLSLG